jgi:hypothetical protein
VELKRKVRLIGVRVSHLEKNPPVPLPAGGEGRGEGRFCKL